MVLAALVLAFNPKVPLEVFAVLMETMMFSMEAAVRAQLYHAWLKLVAKQELNKLGGKVARTGQLYHVRKKLVPAENLTKIHTKYQADFTV